MSAADQIVCHLTGLMGVCDLSGGARCQSTCIGARLTGSPRRSGQVRAPNAERPPVQSQPPGPRIAPAPAGHVGPWPPSTSLAPPPPHPELELLEPQDRWRMRTRDHRDGKVRVASMWIRDSSAVPTLDETEKRMLDAGYSREQVARARWHPHPETLTLQPDAPKTGPETGPTAKGIRMHIDPEPFDAPVTFWDRQTGGQQITCACRVCGCTDDHACLTADGPCWWAEVDLCSACHLARSSAQPGLLLSPRRSWWQRLTSRRRR